MSEQGYKLYFDKKTYSYTLGPFPTYELLRRRPDAAGCVFCSERLHDEERRALEEVCAQAGVRLDINSRALERLRDKDACLVAGVFERASMEISAELSKTSGHIVLENPGGMGNRGTVIRTAAGFGLADIALVGEKCADVLSAKTVRASMGAVFRVRIARFASFADYTAEYGDGRDCYPFMLKGAVSLADLERDESRPFSLIFGNEGAGLDDSYLAVGQSVLIRHTDAIDSLNLSLAAGIGMYEFTKRSMRL